MPENQKKTKKRREKKMRGGIFGFFDSKKDETAVVGEVVAPMEPVPEPKISDEKLAELKQTMDNAKVAYDAAKKAYNDAKPSVFGFFGGKTKKRRSKK